MIEMCCMGTGDLLVPQRTQDPSTVHLALVCSYNIESAWIPQGLFFLFYECCARQRNSSCCCPCLERGIFWANGGWCWQSITPELWWIAVLVCDTSWVLRMRMTRPSHILVSFCQLSFLWLKVEKRWMQPGQTAVWLCAREGVRGLFSTFEENNPRGFKIFHYFSSQSP